jgi:putative membrane protein
MKARSPRLRITTMRTLTPVFALAPSAALAQPADRWDHPMMWGMGGGWLGTILMIVLIAAVVLVLLALAKRLGGDAAPAARREDPLDILKQRLAKGEIDVDEYERRRQALER